MTRLAMALDTVACIGCNACTLACKVENGSPAGIWMAPVIEREFGSFPEVRKAYLPLLCNHCTDAPCMAACPTGAIRRRDDGIVLIDPDVCCGSRACVIACPYGAIHYYDRPEPLHTAFDRAKVARLQPGTAQKCTFCAPRIDRGLQPACVEACPTGARIFGDTQDAESPVSKALATREAVMLGTPLPTGPSVKYLPEGFIKAGGTLSDIALRFRPQKQWQVVQALQFWFLGAGAGVLAASRVLAPEAKLFGFDFGAALAIILVAATCLMLTSHLGRPARFLNALRNWRTNWISRGAIADFVFLAAAAGLAVSPPGALRTPLMLLAVAAAVIVAVYPALAMKELGSVPAWRGWRLPAEALVESLMAGTALVGLFLAWSDAVLFSLLGLSILRFGLAVAWWGAAPARLAATWAGIVALLAAGAIVQPSAEATFGAAAAVAALLAALVAKQANLDSGRSPSPFGPDGELGGRIDAAG